MPRLDELAGTAQELEQVNVADPDVFADALTGAVKAYKDELDALRKVAPDALQDPIDDVERAVSKHDFTAAITAREPLDEFATRAVLGVDPAEQHRLLSWVFLETRCPGTAPVGRSVGVS